MTQTDSFGGAEFLRTPLGLRVPVSPFVSGRRAEKLRNGRYERHEIGAALALTPMGARVLDLGAGLGVVSGTLARERRLRSLTVVEANPRVFPWLARLHTANALHYVHRLNAAVGPPQAHGQTVAFDETGSFLGGHVVDRATPDPAHQRVKTAGIDPLLRITRPDVILCDIEGAEDPVLAASDLQPAQVIVIEFHPKVYGPSGMRACKTRLEALGFQKVEAVSNRKVWGAVRG